MSEERSNIRPRTCKECGRSFPGGPRAWYCPACRKERISKQNKDFKMRKKAGKIVPVGSTIKCEMCGKDIIKRGGLQRFCETCAAKHLKIVDNQQSLDWKTNNPDKIKESKRNHSKIRHSQESIKSGIKGVHWDKGKQLWCACINLYGKQYNIVRSKDISLAIQARKEAEALNIQSIADIDMLKSKYKMIKDNLGGEMENKITVLIEDALQCEDYELRINFLVGNLMSYESNDTVDKERQSTLYLREILDYIENKVKNGIKDGKLDFLIHLKDSINKYLDFPG